MPSPSDRGSGPTAMQTLSLSRRRLMAGAAALPFAGLPLLAGRDAAADIFPAETFRLDNGLEVVVTTNRRVPLVTQLVIYRVGAADEAPGKSGLAHFLEHLMFKGTEKNPPGAFSAAVAAVGGQENAYTSQDATGYWQTVPRRDLETVMALEADRMLNLVLDDAAVLPERGVILEERRSRVDNRPTSLLGEAISSALFRNHPYGIPVIGWEHEMRSLTTEDALDFYRTWYGPQNAILVLGGDIDAAEARPLVEHHYGPLARRGRDSRERPLEPEQRTARRVALESPLATEPYWSRNHLVPHRDTLAAGDLEALQLLSMLLGRGSTSRLYRGLVLEAPMATTAGSWDHGEVLDYPTFGLYARPRPDVDSEQLEAAIDAVVLRLLDEGVQAQELREAKDRLAAAAVLVRDDPMTAPRVIGSSLVVGESLAHLQAWPERVAAVEPEQVTALARLVLDPSRSVTGLLLPEYPA